MTNKNNRPKIEITKQTRKKKLKENRTFSIVGKLKFKILYYYANDILFNTYKKHLYSYIVKYIYIHIPTLEIVNIKRQIYYFYYNNLKFYHVFKHTCSIISKFFISQIFLTFSSTLR